VVSGGISRNINPSYGQSGSKTVADYSIGTTRSLQEREMPIINTTALFKLPKGQAFMNAFGNTYLVHQIMMVDAPCNIFEEFDLIEYQPHLGEIKPVIVTRWQEELAATRRALETEMPRSRGRYDSADEMVDIAHRGVNPVVNGSATAPSREATRGGSIGQRTMAPIAQPPQPPPGAPLPLPTPALDHHGRAHQLSVTAAHEAATPSDSSASPVESSQERVAHPDASEAYQRPPDQSSVHLSGTDGGAGPVVDDGLNIT
jgi:hypothetical protein